MTFRIPVILSIFATMYFPSGVAVADSNVIPTSDFFRPHKVRRVEISPDGALIAVNLVEDGHDKLALIDMQERKGVEVFNGDIEAGHILRDYHWVDSNTILLRDSSGRNEQMALVHWKGIQNGRATAHAERRDLEGVLVDPLPEQENRFLFSVQSFFEDSRSTVYLVDLDDVPLIRAGENVAAQGIEKGYGWITDASGVVRLAMSFGEESGVRHYLHRRDADSPWRNFKTVTGREKFTLAAFTDDPSKILVISNFERDTAALMEFDMEKGEFGEIVFAKSGVDLAAPIVDWKTRRVKGVVYREAGEHRRHYFDTKSAGEYESLKSLFIDQSVMVIGESDDGSKKVIAVYGDRNPGSFHFVDKEALTVELIGKAAPWLESERLAKTVNGIAVSTDDLRIPYYLTLPRRGNRPYPLVVMPHGGPYGVREQVFFNPRVQFLANRGFAVVRLDYRGSAGYGKKFLEAGKKQWGLGIEDDIRAVLEKVRKNDAVDPEKSCIVGGSYGGYSALMSVIRSPGMFRCAASFAGVTDIPLLFASSDWSRSDKLVDHAKETIGDPETEYEGLKARSPVYRADEIEVPVFLAHGSRDDRVDIEHAYRMKVMLDAHEKEYEWKVYMGEGHGLTSTGNQRDYHEKLAAFLSKHLDVELSEPEIGEEVRDEDS